MHDGYLINRFKEYFKITHSLKQALDMPNKIQLNKTCINTKH